MFKQFKRIVNEIMEILTEKPIKKEPVKKVPLKRAKHPVSERLKEGKALCKSGVSSFCLNCPYLNKCLTAITSKSKIKRLRVLT